MEAEDVIGLADEGTAQAMEVGAVVRHYQSGDFAFGRFGHKCIEITVLRVGAGSQTGEGFVNEVAAFGRTGQREGDFLTDGHDDGAGNVRSIGLMFI